MNDSYENTHAMLAEAPPDEGKESKGEGWSMGGEMDQAFSMESSEAAGGSRVNQGTVLMILLLVVAGAALAAMRMGGAASIDESISDVELKIETALAQLGVRSDEISGNGARAGMLADADQVVAIFTTDPSARQVPLEGLRGNPFIMAHGQPDRTASTPTTPTLSQADRERERRLEQLRMELSRLELTTVMNGRVPLAVVSGTVVREGERLGSFSVVSIEPRSVTLTAEGNSYRLTMAEPSVNVQRD